MSLTIFQNEKTPLQGIKTTSSKSSKIDIFAKRLTHGFCLKMVIFPTIFFQSIQAKKMSFTIFQNEKTPFYGIKTTSLKSPKFDIFQKSKNGHFSNFFFCNLGQENVFYNILEWAIKTPFFQRGKPMVLVQKWPFFRLFFQAIQAKKMSFTIFQNKKTPFQAIKTTSLKSSKIDIFPKGLTHGFRPKMAIFPTFFFLANLGQEKIFYDILGKKKTPFQAIKTTSFKSSKIDIFVKG